MVSDRSMQLLIRADLAIAPGEEVAGQCVFARGGIFFYLAGNWLNARRVAVAKGGNKVAVGNAKEHCAGNAPRPGIHYFRQQHMHGGIAFVSLAGEHQLVHAPHRGDIVLFYLAAQVVEC